jgi:pimeloyl-ACP methyl ester carboxylesterase
LAVIIGGIRTSKKGNHMRNNAYLIIAFTISLMILVFGDQVIGQSILDNEIVYGNNSEVGKYAEVNGIKIYYEVYGKGEPLLLIHGNGGNIEGMKYQIDYFSKNYQVIAVDCRGRGNSELGKDTLSYINMTRDIVGLLDILDMDSTYIIGRSDGAIIGLLMGIYFPEKVKKIAAFGANVRPDTTALYPNAVEGVKEIRIKAEEMITKKDTSQDWNLIKQRFRLMEFQPHISTNDLNKIKAPVMVMSCDRDLIKEEHTLYIYRSIPKSNLCIFPGENHWITSTNPELFNKTVDAFFENSFKGEEFRQ